MSIDLRIGYSEISPEIDPLAAIKRCTENKLTVIQLVGDFQTNFPEYIDKKKRTLIKEHIMENDISLHLHAPGDIPLASRHRLLRDAGNARLAEFIELAADIGARSMVFHPGRIAFYKIGSKKIIMADRKIPQAYIERFYSSVQRLTEAVDGRLMLLLENTFKLSDQIIEVIDKVLQLPSTGLAWDIGHMLSLQGINHNESERVAGFFASRLASIKLVHLHDYAGGKSHRALGSGSVNLEPYIELLSELDADIVLEVFSERDLTKSLEYISEVYRKVHR